MNTKQENNELQSRRQFFKKAAKNVLPLLGTIALFNVPLGLIAQEQTKQGGCNASCSNNCYHNCRTTCRTMCGNNCRGSCQIYCMYSCGNACDGTCAGSSMMRTDSISKDTITIKK